MTSERTDFVAGRIVVGVDGSEPSRAALRWAARMAAVTGDGIEAVIAWDFPATYGWAPLMPAGWQPDIEAGKRLEQTLDEVFGTDRPPRLSATVRQGNPARVLLETSRDAALLIVGSRGHGGFAGLLLGSVSIACAEHAKCPVLVVHDQTPAS